MQSVAVSRPGTAAHRKETPTPLSSIGTCVLRPFRAVFNFFFTDCFVPTDTFILKLRKVSCGGISLTFLSLITNFIDFFNTVASNTATKDQLLYAYLELVIYDLIPLITSIVPFIYLRCTKKAPDWVVGVPSLALIVSQIFYALATATIDAVPPLMLMYSILNASMLSRTWMISAFIACIVALITNGLVITRTLDWTIPGARHPYAPEDLSVYISTQMFCFFVLAFAMYIIIKHFDEMINKAQAAATVSKDLARKLRRYDTDGAREVLKRCVPASEAATGGTGVDVLVVDEDLLDAFHGIVENLERYRPHLPNYLLDQGNEDDGASEDDEGELNGSRAVTNKEASTEQGTTRSSRIYEFNTTDETTAEQPSSARLSVEPAVAAAEPTPLVAHIADVGLKRDLVGLLKSKVTVTVVDFQWSPVAAHSDRKPLFDAIVSMANDVALLTQASLHSAIGDQLVATWNATRRIPKPEARGCLFAVRFRDHLAKSAVVPKGAVTVASMTATGPAESCFAGDHRLRLFTCTSTAWTVARAGLDCTKHLQIAATDVSTKDHASVDVSTRGLTLMKAAAASVWVYELLEERAKEEKDQEWMYTLEQHAGDPDSEVTRAFHTYAAGRAEEALQMLRPLAESASYRDNPSIQSLMREMQSAAGTP